MAEDLVASVIVAVRADQRIYRLLDSLLSQTVPLYTYEVIIVENGSSSFKDVVDIGMGAVRYLHLASANAAAARNSGLSVARGRFLLLTDADCVAASDWIEKMTVPLAQGRYSAVGGRILKLSPSTWTQRYAITIVDGQEQLNYLPALPLPYVVGANAGFVTTAVRATGGFDDRFLSGNDVDICYRLGLRGYQVGLAPEATVYHEDRPDVLAHFGRFRHYATYQVLLFRTYRHISRRKYVINHYPLRRVMEALLETPRALTGILNGDVGPASRAVLKLVEAAGVWCGDIHGSIRYRQLYL